tara:strand:+ start:202 stop:828 length:627 start_codon:yes stop_codon:yes gene_type:complete
MDKDSKKALDDKYGVPEDVETFAAGIVDKQDNPTIHELSKSFPEKTYKELESYRNADRHEEANQVPLTQAQKNLVDHIEAAVEKSKARNGTCITAEMRKDREDEPTQMEVDYRKSLEDAAEASKKAVLYDKEHKLRQEAEGELSIMKGIETNRVKEAQEALANALEVNESHQRLNGKLQVRIAELEDENKKMHDTLDKQLEGARKAGL